MDLFDSKKQLLIENEQINEENERLERALEEATELFNCSTELELLKRIEGNKVLEYPESNETLLEI